MSMTIPDVPRSACDISLQTLHFEMSDAFDGEVIDPQSLHKYAYVHGDPVNGVDPTGRVLGAIVVGTLSGFGLNTKKSQGDLIAGKAGGLAAWALWTKRSIDLLFYSHFFGAHTFAQIFRSQGRLSHAIAQTYANRVGYGATGFGQIYTRLFDDGYELIDDGSMRLASSKARKYWLFEKAVEQGLLKGQWNRSDTWVSVRTNAFEDTKRVFAMPNTFFVNGVKRFEGHGQFEMRLIKEGPVHYFVEVKNLAVHWVANDDADANPAAEKDTNRTLWLAESYVGHVGDGLLGADFNFSIHDQQVEQKTRKYFIAKSEINARMP